MSQSLHKVRFLVVDDNVHMIQLVKTILKGFGAAHVFEAKNPAEAFHALGHDAIDIIVLDYVMGEEDGVGLVRKIRRDEASPNPYIPIIMLTSHSERRRVETARDAGVNEFCTKPVTPAELLRKIAAVIDHPRAFVRNDAYFGPDRRRHHDPNYTGPERREEMRDPRTSESE
jgi:CheY-like chemotaxis protein